MAMVAVISLRMMMTITITVLTPMTSVLWENQIGILQIHFKTSTKTVVKISHLKTLILMAMELWMQKMRVLQVQPAGLRAHQPITTVTDARTALRTSMMTTTEFGI